MSKFSFRLYVFLLLACLKIIFTPWHRAVTPSIGMIAMAAFGVVTAALMGSFEVPNRYHIYLDTPVSQLADSASHPTAPIPSS